MADDDVGARADRAIDIAATYDPIARALHWLIAGLAVIVVGLGLMIPLAARESATRAAVLLPHRSLGLVILALTVFRIAWRLRHPPPPLPAGFPWIEVAAARTDHMLLYLIFLVMPLSGYINAAAAGLPVSLFGITAIPPLLPMNYRLSLIADAVHLAAQFALYGVVGLHVAAVLYHRIRGRYQIVERMLPRLRTLPPRRRPPG